MSFADRTYPDVVRGLLTTLTGGVVGEVHDVPPEGLDRILLEQRPVRRVSFVQGKVAQGEALIDYRFTERDFELVGTPERPDELVAVQFKPGKRRPAPSTRVTVEYHPLRTRPTPLDDLAVGSVVRTLLETVGREIATQYQQLQIVYDSAFVDTAAGPSLDKVAELLAVRRLKKGHPLAKVRFKRRAGEGDLVTLPVGTAVRDRKGARYLTSDLATLEPGQASVDVWAQGELTGTPLVEADALTILERALAGVESVTNPEPAFRAGEDEADDQLRARTRVAVHGAGRGTPNAIRYGLQSLPFVTSVALTEPPDTLPGTLRVDVALAPDNPANRALVRERIRELRPAGILVEESFAARAAVAFDVGLTLTSASQPASVVSALQTQVRAALTSHIGAIPPGGPVRAARLAALVLQVDDRIADASVGLSLAGAAVSGNTNLPAGQVADTPTFSFRPTAFTDAAGSAATSVTLTAQLRVTLVGSTTLAEATAGLRTKLDALLTALAPGESVTFTRLAAAVRNDAAWVVVATDAIYTFTRADGTFADVRASGGTWTPAPGELSATGALDVEEAS
jgi:uncharacterized phage protein gp47/JayE